MRLARRREKEFRTNLRTDAPSYWDACRIQNGKSDFFCVGLLSADDIIEMKRRPWQRRRRQQKIEDDEVIKTYDDDCRRRYHWYQPNIDDDDNFNQKYIQRRRRWLGDDVNIYANWIEIDIDGDTDNTSMAIPTTHRYHRGQQRHWRRRQIHRRRRHRRRHRWN